MTSSRKGRPITVEIIGGLGNQIFIYAAGLEQASRLGVELQLDLSWFASQDKREFQLSKLFDVKEAPSSGMEAFGSRISKALNIRSLQPQMFIESSEDFSPEIFDINPGTRLRGYFQSSKYFPNVGHQIAKAIYSSDLSDLENNVVGKLIKNKFNAIHVRRGDYAEDPVTRAHHGLTSRKYFENSLRLLPNPDLPTLVFTDSIEIAQKELEGIPNLLFADELRSLGDVATLNLLSHATSIVMSNSSFSWWAAFVISQINSKSTVISPRPWSQTIFFNNELIQPNWINLGM